MSSATFSAKCSPKASVGSGKGCSAVIWNSRFEQWKMIETGQNGRAKLRSRQHTCFCKPCMEHDFIHYSHSAIFGALREEVVLRSRCRIAARQLHIAVSNAAAAGRSVERLVAVRIRKEGRTEKHLRRR